MRNGWDRMKKNKKRKIKKYVIFNIASIIFVFSVGIFFLGRMIYAKIESEKPVTYSSILRERLIEQSEEDFVDNALVLTNGIYRYVGKVDTNYVKYKGLIWRILRINEDGTVSLVTEETITSLAYGNTIRSNILSWLNKEDSNDTGILETALEEKDDELQKNLVCMDDFRELESAGCFEKNYDYKIGILSVYDYLMAEGNENFLNNETYFWTSNTYDATSSWYVSDSGLVGTNSNSTKYGIRPVITISGDISIVGGEGTVDSPFLLEERTVNTLEDLYVGEYLTFNNTLWRVVSKNANKMKIVSEDCLKDEDGEDCLVMPYSSYDNTPSLGEENVLSYLNDTYYDSLADSKFLTNGVFYAGSYSLEENNYRDIFLSQVSFPIGILAAFEPFAFEIPNTFLMTSSVDNDLSIYTVNDNHSLYESMVTESYAIRPALYLKSDIQVTSGDGSYLSPFQLGGTQNGE